MNNKSNKTQRATCRNAICEIYGDSTEIFKTYEAQIRVDVNNHGKWDKRTIPMQLINLCPNYPGKYNKNGNKKLENPENYELLPGEEPLLWCLDIEPEVPLKDKRWLTMKELNARIKKSESCLH